MFCNKAVPVLANSSAIQYPTVSLYPGIHIKVSLFLEETSAITDPNGLCNYVRQGLKRRLAILVNLKIFKENNASPQALRRLLNCRDICLEAYEPIIKISQPTLSFRRQYKLYGTLLGTSGSSNQNLLFEILKSNCSTQRIIRYHIVV